MISYVSPMQKFKYIFLFIVSWFEQEPFINDKKKWIGIFIITLKCDTTCTEPSKITCGQIVHKWENVYNKEIEEPQEE